MEVAESYQWSLMRRITLHEYHKIFAFADWMGGFFYEYPFKSPMITRNSLYDFSLCNSTRHDFPNLRKYFQLGEEKVLALLLYTNIIAPGAIKLKCTLLSEHIIESQDLIGRYLHPNLFEGIRFL